MVISRTVEPGLAVFALLTRSVSRLPGRLFETCSRDVAWYGRENACAREPVENVSRRAARGPTFIKWPLIEALLSGPGAHQGAPLGQHTVEGAGGHG